MKINKFYSISIICIVYIDGILEELYWKLEKREIFLLISFLFNSVKKELISKLKF